MRVWHDLGAVEDLGPAVVTIGTFDGVHRGHRAVLARAGERAGELGGIPVVALTFDPHPMRVLRPDHAPLLLCDVERRVELLGAAGADAVLVLPFGREVSNWSPQEFIDRVVVGALRARAVVVGENFRFGQKAAGRVATLTEAGETAGFEVHGLTLAGDAGPEHRAWSSTYIRERVAEGDVEAAAEALGRPLRLTGVVVEGDHRGHELGFPTANIPRRAEQRGPARRGVRRPAHRARARPGRAVVRRRDAGRDQRRHQPDVRRRGPAGRVVRAGPRRPRAVRRACRGRLRAAAARAR